MGMRLRAITLSGFRGVHGDLTIAVPPGFLVITGRNGSGKSTVCDAIEFALTGNVGWRSLEKESGEGFREYLWWKGKVPSPSQSVVLDLVGDDGSQLQVFRNASGDHSPSPDTLSNKLCHVGAAPSDPLAALCRFAIIRGETLPDLSVDSSETERFAFVRAAAGSADLSVFANRAREAAKVLKSRLDELERNRDLGRSRLTDLLARLSAERSLATKAMRDDSTTAGMIDILKRQGRDLSIPEEGARQELTAAAERVAAGERLLARLERAASALSGPAAQESERRVSELTAEIGELDKRLSNATASQGAARTTLDQLHLTETHDTLRMTLYEAGRKLGREDGKCPLCMSSVSEEAFASSIQRHLDAVESNRAQLVSLIDAESAASREARSLAEQARRARDLLADLVDAKRHAMAEAEIAGNEASSLGLLPADVAPESVIPFLNQALDRLRKDISILSLGLAVSRNSGGEARIVDLERQVDTLRSDIATNDTSLRRAQAASERLKAVADIARRIEGEVIEERLAALSPVLTELYARLRPHPDWPSLQYELRGDVRRFLSLRVDDDRNPRFFFSSGQRRALGLAFLLAVGLSSEWSRLDTLILDDPVQHIDDFRALHLVEALASIRQSGKQVLITVEDPALADLLGRRLRSELGAEGRVISLEYRLHEGVALGEQRSIEPLPKLDLLSA